MSPQAAASAGRRGPARRTVSRQEAARRRTVQRRRRWTFGLLGAVGLIALVIVAMPDVRKVYNDLTLPLEYQDIIRSEAAAENLDPALVAGVIDTETKFIPRTSPTGAEGLMQIEPATAESLARQTNGYAFRVSDLSKPDVNIKYGCYYLHYLMGEYGGNKVEALAAYNGGETNVNHWIAAAQQAGHSFGVGDIPFPETRAYVVKVLEAQRDYRHTYASELGYR